MFPSVSAAFPNTPMTVITPSRLALFSASLRGLYESAKVEDSRAAGRCASPWDTTVAAVRWQQARISFSALIGPEGHGGPVSRVVEGYPGYFRVAALSEGVFAAIRALRRRTRVPGATK